MGRVFVKFSFKKQKGEVMTDIKTINRENRINSSLKSLWKISLLLYIVCNTAFASKSYLMMLNSYAMYFFLGVSVICIAACGFLRFNLYTLSMLIFIPVMLLGNLYSKSSYAISYTYDYFVAFCIVFCIMNYIEGTEDIIFIFKCLMIGGLVLDIYVLSIYGSGFIDAIMSQTRVGEVAGNVNDVGLKSCYSALIALYFIFNSNQNKYKPFYLILCVVCIFFSLITASKKVLILLIIGVVFLFLFNGKKKNVLKIIRNILLAVSVSLLFIYLVYNVKYFEYLRIRVDELFKTLLNSGGNSSDQKRMRFLIEGMRVFYEHPFLGDGTAASFKYFGTYSHSNFVELLMNHGILGFVCFYFSYPIIIFRCFKKRTLKESETDMTYMCLFLFLSIIILSVALVYYTFVYYQILLAVSAAYVLNSSMKQDKETVQ